MEDAGQWFGLPAPLDATGRLNTLLAGRSVASATVGDLGDLAVRFGDDATLEVFNASTGYEGWQLFGPGARLLVAQGGGDVVERTA